MSLYVALGAIGVERRISRCQSSRRSFQTRAKRAYSSSVCTRPTRTGRLAASFANKRTCCPFMRSSRPICMNICPRQRSWWEHDSYLQRNVDAAHAFRRNKTRFQTLWWTYVVDSDRCLNFNIEATLFQNELFSDYKPELVTRDLRTRKSAD